MTDKNGTDGKTGKTAILLQFVLQMLSSKNATAPRRERIKQKYTEPKYESLLKSQINQSH